ncbi:Complex I intermediate-associated protein 30, mitochondrial, partial [Choanephora cucurbitarum]
MFSLFRRTASELADSSLKAINLDGLRGWQKEMPIASLKTEKDRQQWAIGCDKDIGGFSEAELDVVDGVGRFHGKISLDLPTNQDIKQSGYAAIRTKPRDQTLFGTPCFDTSLFRYLALRVKGDERKYFVNIQTDGVVKTDLFQHRLFLRTPGQWETVMIPFKDFILTNNGMIQEDQLEMFREKVKTVGISLMDRKEGPFEIHVEWVKAMNTEFTEGDLDRIPPKKDTPIY